LSRHIEEDGEEDSPVPAGAAFAGGLAAAMDEADRANVADDDMDDERVVS